MAENGVVEQLDVLVIGSGPGGYVAAIRAAQLGKQVAIVEKEAVVGGVCLNKGCIPSKALISVAHQYEATTHSREIGLQVAGVSVDFAKVQEWKQSVIDKLTGGVKSLLKGNKVQRIQGEAKLVGDDLVQVTNGEETSLYRFAHCILATGSRPIELKAFPYEGRILSSTEALTLPEIPKSLVVIGGGYIGIELGQTYAKLGAKVTILEGSDSILPGFEKEMSRFVGRKLKKLGVEVQTGAIAKEAQQTVGEVTITYEVKGELHQVSSEYLLITVGRRPNIDQLGLETVNMKLTERGFIQVDQQCKTSVQSIYAIGDIVEGLALAHKASYEGKIAAEVIAGLNSSVSYKTIPAVVFSDPEIASVGLNETEAKNQGYTVSIGKFPYAANGRALSLNAGDGFVKIIGDSATGAILGGQIVGPEASNLIGEIGLAIEKGHKLQDIAHTIHAHPSLGEIIMEAAEGALGQGIHQLSR
ncbi:dihydrolipoyl dehydrogenase [Brevibacillus reuszeri]|uniref:Dihydrolipoyl dehydrogenase n=1 Tax=Brevibacillus reuszeri TaxID=54915 RepID=A0A0K9YXV4_9BACL|nr:dihydrolipoyl dehydrogenase [Brevibacillus reuszeri]KNB73491.1 dihydrolipoamide dehydrogenase [Brevibacillus reuszeri]MED1858716.1 dihydrolipoyl dehydrogenase [Brevibacillus reuszeri]GED69696.1 dihydrolipoyl dehydrogenase [Brevibacillus reuszeri]